MDTKWKPYFFLTITTVLVVGSVLVIYKYLSIVPTLPPVTLHNTTITNSMVVEKIQKVAKVVSSEVTVRDVVTYENTWVWLDQTNAGSRDRENNGWDQFGCWL